MKFNPIPPELQTPAISKRTKWKCVGKGVAPVAKWAVAVVASLIDAEAVILWSETGQI
jgi:hypothetical protein